jgi:ABC-2 type transport system permease protein
LNPFFYLIDGFRFGFFGQSDVSPYLSFGVASAAFVLVSSFALYLLKIGYKIRA